MRFKIYTTAAIMGLLTMFVNNSANAQRKRRASGYQSSYGSSSYGRTTTPANTKAASKTNTQKATTSGYGTTTPSGYGAAASNATSSVDTTLPMEVVKSGSGLLEDTKPSLRNDAPFQQSFLEGATPLAYQTLRQDDVPFKVRVWREIDTREKLNKRFNYDGADDSGNRRFINILLRGIRDEGITAFSGDDDRFTTPITPEQAISAFGGGMDTSAKYDMQGNVDGYQVRAKAIDPDSIYKFRIKEDWLFDRNTGRMFVRIIGIAPVIPFRMSTGEIMPNSEHAAFWVYYPDLRPVLVKNVAYNPYNPGSRTTWEDVFEGREFSSYVVKSDLNNAGNANFASFIKDPMFRLYEGEKVKDKIFNYEQSLWSY